jgi:hypothetical protein
MFNSFSLGHREDEKKDEMSEKNFANCHSGVGQFKAQMLPTDIA